MNQHNIHDKLNNDKQYKDFNTQSNPQTLQPSMRSKIRYDLLLNSQKYAKTLHHPFQTVVYSTAYNYIKQMRSDIKKTFTNVCIHGNFPQLIIPELKDLNRAGQNIESLCLHSHIMDPQLGNKWANIKFLDSTMPFTALKKSEQEFDLIISCLVGHHYDMDKLMKNYEEKLKPDGAIIGCCWAQNTLKQLQWAYLMAQNQRSGGVSPKIYNFPSLGTIGHSMTVSNIKLPTIVVRDIEVEVDSVVDLFTMLQILGQSGIMHGKRKGVFKDVHLAASAFFNTQFRQNQDEKQKKSVMFSLQLGVFVGWKEHSSQSQPLSRSQAIKANLFSELKKNDPDAKLFRISENSDIPQQVNTQINQQQWPKSPPTDPKQ